jgi:O-antigen/teichoic acid export membrane protein
MSLLAMKRMIPRFSLRPQFDVSTLSRLMSFSLYSQAAKVAALVSESVSRILVGFMLGPVAVSFFAIPLRALATFQGIAVRLSRVIFPVAADLVARNEAERLRIVFRKSSRYLMLFVTPIFVWLGVFSRQILTLWMGEDFAEHSWLIMTIGSVAYWMVCWSLVPSNIAFGLGNAKINATFSVLVGATNLILIIFLSKVFGVVGAALALLIVQVQTPFFVYLISSRLLKSDGIQDLRTSYLLPSISGLSCVPFAIFINPTSFIGLLGSAIVVVILFVAILFLLRVVHKEEAKYLIGLLSLKNLRRERF